MCARPRSPFLPEIVLGDKYMKVDNAVSVRPAPMKLRMKSCPTRHDCHGLWTYWSGGWVSQSAGTSMSHEYRQCGARQDVAGRAAEEHLS
jgi:hypothetical protein